MKRTTSKIPLTFHDFITEIREMSVKGATPNSLIISLFSKLQLRDMFFEEKNSMRIEFLIVNIYCRNKLTIRVVFEAPCTHFHPSPKPWPRLAYMLDNLDTWSEKKNNINHSSRANELQSWIVHDDLQKIIPYIWEKGYV